MTYEDWNYGQAAGHAVREGFRGNIKNRSYPSSAPNNLLTIEKHRSPYVLNLLKIIFYIFRILLLFPFAFFPVPDSVHIFVLAPESG
jgi:hypothetical protein